MNSTKAERFLDVEQQAKKEPDRRYRASLNLELQKFPNQEKYRQMNLFESAMREAKKAGKTEMLGIEFLTVPQIRALSAVQILLDRTGYQGNKTALSVKSEAFKWEGNLPRLFISFQEYLEAYGLEKNVNSGRYNRNERDEAIKSLYSLMDPITIGYRRKYYEGEGKKRQQVSDLIVTRKALVEVSKYYKGLTEKEEKLAMQNLPIPGKKAIGLMVQPSVILLDQIDTFYILKPVKLYREIADLLSQDRKRAKVSKIYIALIEWILTKNTQKIKVTTGILAERIGLGYLVKQRHKSRLKKEIEAALNIALKLQYLQKWTYGEWGGYTLIINPRRAGRTLKQLEPGEKLKEEIT